MNYSELYQSISSYAETTEQLFLANIPVFVQETELRVYNTVQIPALRRNVTGNATAGNPYLSLPDDWLSNYSIAAVGSDGVYEYLLNKDVNFIREAFPTPTMTGKPTYYALFGQTYGNTNEMSLILGPTPNQDYEIEMHYYYYPPTIVQGQITTTSGLQGGSLYTDGVYQNVYFSGGNGMGAYGDIVVIGQTVTACTVKFGGNFYAVGDVLTVDNTLIGGSGINFSITVSAITNAVGTSWLGDNYDSVLLYGALREAVIFQKGEQDMVSYYGKMYEEALGQLKRLGDGLERGDAYRNGQTKLPYNGL